MRTEDDARHRPIPGDLYLCHYKTAHTHIQRVVSIGAQHIGFESLNFGGRSSGNLHAYWASSGLDDAAIAAGAFERWIPAPEVTPETPARDPATHPQVCDRWAYDAPDGVVDIEVLEVRPNKVGFRYGTSYLNWSPGGFSDICKHWRLVCLAAPEVVRGGNP